MRKIKLVDGNSIMFRAYYATAYGNKDLLKTNQGQYTNALFGFINMLEKIITTDTTDCLVAFDTDQKTERHLKYKDYKAGRKEVPRELIEQIKPIQEYVRLKGLKVGILGGYEADDIIGTLAKDASKKGIKVDVYSSDKDLLQLVDDNITVHMLKSGMKEVDDYTYEEVFNKYGLYPDQMIDLKALMGDPSDNIKGVPGIGEKTAIKLLVEYGTLDNLYANVEKVTGKNKDRLIENKESAYFSKYLATINLDVPLGYDSDHLKIEAVNQKELLDFLISFELNSFAKKHQTEESPKIEISCIELIDYQDIKNVLKPNLSVYLETSNPNYHKAELWGFSLSDGVNNYFIEPDLALSSIDFICYLQDPDIAKFTFDYKALIGALKWHKIQVKGVVFDLLLGAYLSNSRLGKEDFKTITNAFSYYDCLSDDEIYGKGAKKKLGDKKTYMEHIASKALAIFKLRDQVIAELKEKEQYELLVELEIPLSEVLADMEYTGFKVDLVELEKANVDFKIRIKDLQNEIYQLAGEEFNISSPKQLGTILFENLNLPTSKKTKTGYSTNIEVLEALKGYHPIIDKLMEYRQ
ncbi:hypothetical protein LJC17_05175, partial [Acholeplasma sp. OttesenSCG-928-E16]|nr:hypothetical protein [Acholeplasma sp. OttesenSCG-928-E16]